MQDLLRQYGIHRPADLAHAARVDRRYAWAVWWGKRKIGATLAMRLHEALGIPIYELLRAGVAPTRPPRGRPRKRPPEMPSPPEEGPA